MLYGAKMRLLDWEGEQGCRGKMRVKADKNVKSVQRRRLPTNGAKGTRLEGGFRWAVAWSGSQDPGGNLYPETGRTIATKPGETAGGF